MIGFNSFVEVHPHPVLADHPVVSASLGVATPLVRDCSAADLVIHADMALYAAKHNDRDQVWPPLGSTSGNLRWNAQPLLTAAV